MSEKKKKSNDEALEHNLKIKGIVIPIVFALVVVIICVIISTSHLSIFPSGNHKDSLTTTAPTQTTEYNDNDLRQTTQK